jgi:hypothetical protein
MVVGRFNEFKSIAFLDAKKGDDERLDGRD